MPETDGTFLINADLPGVTAANVSVEVENRVLVTKATKE
jgi:HSP20 family molecular chaperone IbpA